MLAVKTAFETKQLSIRVVEDRFEIPKSTIHDHVAGKSSKIGADRTTVLIAEQEKSIQSFR